MSKKPVIVSDSSPLISLARAGRFSLIQKVWSQIVIPDAVYREVVEQGRGRPGGPEVSAALEDWIFQKSVADNDAVKLLSSGTLGIGESEAIVLSEEMNGVLLVDDEAATKEALRRGINVVSTLTVVVIAKEKGYVESAEELFEELDRAGFYFDEQKALDLLKKLGEK